MTSSNQPDPLQRILEWTILGGIAIAYIIPVFNLPSNPQPSSSAKPTATQELPNGRLHIQNAPDADRVAMRAIPRL